MQTGFLHGPKHIPLIIRTPPRLGHSHSWFNCTHYACTWAPASPACTYIWTAGISVFFMTATLGSFLLLLLMYIHYKSSTFTLFKMWKTVREKGSEGGGYCDVPSRRNITLTDLIISTHPKKETSHERKEGRRRELRGRSDFQYYLHRRAKRLRLEMAGKGHFQPYQLCSHFLKGKYIHAFCTIKNNILLNAMWYPRLDPGLERALVENYEIRRKSGV